MSESSRQLQVRWGKLGRREKILGGIVLVLALYAGGDLALVQPMTAKLVAKRAQKVEKQNELNASIKQRQALSAELDALRGADTSSGNGLSTLQAKANQRGVIWTAARMHDVVGSLIEKMGGDLVRVSIAEEGELDPGVPGLYRHSVELEALTNWPKIEAILGEPNFSSQQLNMLDLVQKEGGMLGMTLKFHAWSQDRSWGNFPIIQSANQLGGSRE